MLYIGFTDVEQTKLTGDYGVDILAYKDGYTYAIQCKRRASNVGNKAIQEVFTGKAHYNCDKAIVMTNSTFTKNAIELAKDTEVELFDRSYLQSILSKSSI